MLIITSDLYLLKNIYIKKTKNPPTSFGLKLQADLSGSDSCSPQELGH